MATISIVNPRFTSKETYTTETGRGKKRTTVVTQSYHLNDRGRFENSETGEEIEGWPPVSSHINALDT